MSRLRSIFKNTKNYGYVISPIKKGKNMLSGKKILFFAPAFFGYEHIIKQKMEHMQVNYEKVIK